MSEAQPTLSAGTLLRQARAAQGVHIAMLAAQMKVTQRKLEALEADRFDELPDPAFVRALALGVCRQLKIDAEPVLARLPQPNAIGLEKVARGLDTPFRDRPGREPDDERTLIEQPVVWGPALILVAALLLWSAPSSWLGRSVEPEATAASAVAIVAPSAPTAASVPAVPAPSAVTEPPAPPAPVVETVHSVPPPAAGEAVSTPTASPLVLRTTGPTWIEVMDAQGRTLLSRTVQAGETLGLDGATPLKLRIGNAAATQVSYRGQPVDLARVTRDNIARLELK
jgi:cytoskeleton protein RodZ